MIHGISKTVSVPAIITVKDGKISSNAKFNIKIADFGIKVPSVVTKKIAEVIEVTVDCNYEPMKKQ